MQRFHAAHPGVSLKLSITNTGQVVRQVAEGAVDLGFVEDQVDAEGLEVRAVAQDELVLVVAPSTLGPIAIRQLPILLTCAITPGCCVNRNRVRAGSSKSWCAA
jgi:DNA-binding transcriptional LysR family regulator